jgi:hypothetical protein
MRDDIYRLAEAVIDEYCETADMSIQEKIDLETDLANVIEGNIYLWLGDTGD